MTARKRELRVHHVRWRRELVFATNHAELGGAEVVQEPMAQDYGVRDCAFRDPAGNLVRIQERP